MYIQEDIKFMKLALKLAAKAKGKTSPNPFVGAVIVKDGKIIGSGYHQKAGEPHAEILALNKAGSSAKNAILYINLEPCCHFGKTPPCIDKIIDLKISKVYVAMIDPNPLINGKGIALLKAAGIEVFVGLLENQAKELNEIFIKYITTQIPFITLKAAVSIDGKICTKTGDSKWISNEYSRKYVHLQRKYNDAVLVGSGTILKDNPFLTCRINKNKIIVPYKIILDSKLIIDLNANIFKTGDYKKIIIATSEKAPATKINELKQYGINVIVIGRDKVDLNSLFKILGGLNITSILVEGGNRVNTSIIEQNLFDKIQIFIAPFIIGNKDALSFTDGNGLKFLKDANRLKLHKIKRFKDDLMIEYIKVSTSN